MGTTLYKDIRSSFSRGGGGGGGVGLGGRGTWGWSMGDEFGDGESRGGDCSNDGT
jgi:hypothetical protein